MKPVMIPSFVGMLIGSMNLATAAFAKMPPDNEIFRPILGATGIFILILGAIHYASLLSEHNVIGMARRWEAPNLIRQIPRRRHLRLVILL